MTEQVQPLTKEEVKEIQRKIALKRWEQAEKISLAEAWEKYECLYVNDIDAYIHDMFAFDDFIKRGNMDVSSLQIYATYKQQISICAASVVEFACDELHEDAYDRCDVDGLQKLLDEWCLKQTGTMTYLPDYCVGVVL